jgi:class 3 adenylate cyclase
VTASEPSEPRVTTAARAADPSVGAPGGENTSVRVVFFSDMKGSTTLKQDMAAKWDESTFQRLRRQHDALLTEIITRDRAGEVVKSTGDGFLATFERPSVAVERALEIQ